MSGTFIQAAQFLIEALVGMYLFAVMLRFLLQWVQASFYNPLSQFVVKLTNPVLLPLRRFIPGYGGVDVACIVLMLLVEILKYLALYGLLFGSLVRMDGLFLLCIADLAQQFSNLYFFTIMMVVILSWVTPNTYNPITELFHKITAPVLRPFQRFIPAIAGFDLSPLFALMALKTLDIVVLNPFSEYARFVAI